MINENDGILLEMYLDEALEGAALAEFKKRLEQEPELAAAWRDREQLHQFLKHQPKREELEKTLPKLGEKHFGQEAIIRPLWHRNAFKAIGIAASIAILIFIWQPWKSTSVYDQFAQHKTLALAERGNQTLDPSTIEKAFAQKQYEKALPLLEAYLQNNPQSIEAALYRGICYLEIDNFDSAEAIFENIAEGESSFKYDALWYRALTAIKQNDFEKAKTYLKGIPGDSDYYQKAKILLSKI